MGDLLSLKTTYMITATAAILSIPFVFFLKPTHIDKINDTSDKLKE
jgi:ABC-type phosphate/phosphonate transport system permease subunit